MKVNRRTNLACRLAGLIEAEYTYYLQTPRTPAVEAFWTAFLELVNDTSNRDAQQTALAKLPAAREDCKTEYLIPLAEDLLLLVGYKTIVPIRELDIVAIELIIDWAAREHLSASDNNNRRMAQPVTVERIEPVGQ